MKTEYAFPLKGFYEQHEGMTLRDYFAATALSALITTSRWPMSPAANPEHVCDIDENKPWSEGELVEYAYNAADAMMEEREKKIAQ